LPSGKGPRGTKKGKAGKNAKGGEKREEVLRYRKKPRKMAKREVKKRGYIKGEAAETTIRTVQDGTSLSLCKEE